jgi:hypothetical protein
MVFGVVSVALIWKRLYNRDLPFKQQQMPFWLIVLMVLSSIGKFRVGIMVLVIGLQPPVLHTLHNKAADDAVMM